MRRAGLRIGRLAVIAGALALAAPATAAAARKPVATTGGASNVGEQTALLNGTVNARGAATAWYFEYGPTRSYGARTPDGAAGGSSRVRVTGTIGALAPATRYHYRLVAQNAKGVSRGKDRTFKTKRQPLGVTLLGAPNPVRTGASTTLAGTLTGTGNAGRQVVLQANPWPYTQGFLNAANPQVTNAQGAFAFPILSVPVNTQFRVLMPQKPEVISPIVALGTKVRVTTHLRVRRHPHHATLRFKGRLEPAVDGTQVLIQKFVDGKWTNIDSTVARHKSHAASRYRKKLRQQRGGRYRVYHNAVEPHVPNTGKDVRVRHVPR